MRDNFDDFNFSEDQINRFKREKRNDTIKFFFKALLLFLGIFFGWKFFTSPPSTTDVCYTWSKATDDLLPYDESGVDGAQWLADNLKTEKDLQNIDPDVLSAMRLYDTGAFLEDIDPSERMGLRQFVLDACEKVSPGSTKH